MIIPSFNYEAYVGLAIDSVLQQDYPHRELIVVDDGSSDASWDIISRYGDAIRALQVPNGGPLRACMHAVRQAAGEYIYILDSDDLLVGPWALKTIAQAIEPGVAKVQFPLIPIDARGKRIGPPSPSLGHSDSSSNLQNEVLATGCYLTPPTSGNVYRRDVWMLAESVDYEIWTDGIAYLAAPFLGRVINIGEPLACHREHDCNASLEGGPINRMRMERDAFVARLDHLSSLMGAGFRTKLKTPETCFAYLERLVLETIWAGQPLPAALADAALNSAIREPRAPRRRLLLALWLLTLRWAPAHTLKQWLAGLKLPYSQRSASAALVRKLY